MYRDLLRPSPLAIRFRTPKPLLASPGYLSNSSGLGGMVMAVDQLSQIDDQFARIISAGDRCCTATLVIEMRAMASQMNGDSHILVSKRCNWTTNDYICQKIDVRQPCLLLKRRNHLQLRQIHKRLSESITRVHKPVPPKLPRLVRTER